MLVTSLARGDLPFEVSSPWTPLIPLPHHPIPRSPPSVPPHNSDPELFIFPPNHNRFTLSCASLRSCRLISLLAFRIWTECLGACIRVRAKAALPSEIAYRIWGFGMSMRRMSNMVPNFDLNEYPTEADEAAADALLLVAHEVVDAEPPDGPIDVDAADDEVVVVSPPPAGRRSWAASRLRAAPPSEILIDEDPDNRQLDSAEEEATRLTLYSFDWPAGNIQNPPKRAIINCDNYESLDSKHEAKKTRVEENPKPKTEASKEPTFNCTICWGPLVEETTTTCGHIFCQQCIKAAIRIQKRCPTCRKSLTMKSIHRIYLPAASQ